ncbi:MAG: type IV pilin-like G/H family protein [Leptolyngbyaceae cyanobacterium]
MTIPKHSQTDCGTCNRRWLHYLLRAHNYHNHEGFTLTELVVIIMIVGILAAIAFPSIVSRAQQARESEARLYINSVGKSQQVYYLEHGRFASSWPKLGIGIPDITSNYSYRTQEDNDAGSGSVVALTEATQLVPQLRSFSGQVWTGAMGQMGLTTSVLCEGEVGQSPPVIVNHECP